MNEFLESQAALYASGVMTAQEREQFELILEFHPELRELVAELEEVSVALILANTPSNVPVPSKQLKERVMELIADRPQNTAPDGIVVTNPDAFVQWVNPAFIELCGYSLDEVRGKKLGPILQGADTDRETAARVRSAVHACRPCRETLLNYHKDGTPYFVDVTITPIVDDSGKPLWLIARERMVSAPAAA